MPQNEHGITGALTTSARTDIVILSGLSFTLFLYLMLIAAFSGYGYFIDELYYIACSNRLAFGYVDHPPLSIALLALSRWLFGDSLLAVRLLPSLAAAGTVFLTGMMARRLGGNGMAAIIAALATIAAPVYLVMGSFYSMNVFEILIWTGILLLFIKLVQEEQPKYWLAIGLLMGLGLEMKHTMILYSLAVGAGLLLTSSRRFLWSKWLLAGMVVCVALIVPNLVWQFANGFPSAEFYRNAMVNKNIPTGPTKVVLQQILFINPLALPLWLAGLAYCLFSREAKTYRFFGWTFLVLLAVMILTQSSRPDRIASMYTILFALGGVAIARISIPIVRRLVVPAAVIILVAGIVLAAPIASPLLPPSALNNYLSTLGISFDIERGKRNEALPQWIADRLGWHELAAEVGKVYHALPPDEQRNAVIVSTNYGEAGALELYGPEFGLPPVYATHNSYFLWGPPSDSVKTYIAVFVNRRDIEQKFESVEEAGVQTCEYCTRPQQRIPIYVARGPRFAISAAWPGFKIYD
jgi:4-amino-4-deoxy-L-arabinose transferase-like glycosyltransferase